MDDLISRQWLMECINEGWIKFDTEKDANTYIHLVRDIAPPAQPEQKKRRWEQVEVSYLSDMDAEIKESMAIASMFCPKCKRYHNEVYLYGNPKFGVNFCPNCGADMRGEQNG